jgi:hypothetical protein
MAKWNQELLRDRLEAYRGDLSDWFNGESFTDGPARGWILQAGVVSSGA